jgi:phage tail-like protein
MRQDDWLINQLPVGMTDDDFLVRYLGIFQALADTVIEQVDNLPKMFDPSVAPDEMVRTMAQWLGVEWVDSSLPDRVQREIVRRYAELIQWRGTKTGVRMLLELLTDDDVEVRDTGGVFHEGESPGAPSHVRLNVVSSGWNRTDDLIRIVRAELPATVTFDMWVGSEHVWPPADPATATVGHLPSPTETVAAGTTDAMAATRNNGGSSDA